MAKRTYEETMEDEAPTRRQHSVAARFRLLRRHYSHDHYDPYQKEQLNEKEQLREKVGHDERPAKRRKSLASMLKYGLVQGALFGGAIALTAFDYMHRAKLHLDDRKQLRGHGVDFHTIFQPQSPVFEKRAKKTEALIRSICLDQQAYALNKQCNTDDHFWGIVKEDYNVDFAMLPPPKPQRTFARYFQAPS